MSGLGAEAERRSGLVAGEPGGAARDVEEGDGSEPCHLGGAGGGEDAVEDTGAGGRHLGIEDLEAVEEDAGGDAGVADVRDRQLVRGREERDGDVGLERGGARRRRSVSSATRAPLTKTWTWWSTTETASEPPWR